MLLLQFDFKTRKYWILDVRGAARFGGDISMKMKTFINTKSFACSKKYIHIMIPQNGDIFSISNFSQNSLKLIYHTNYQF